MTDFNMYRNLLPDVATAAALAAGTAWLFNGRILYHLGHRGLGWVTPLVEEAAKTLWAVILEAPILWTHIGFGVIEALVEVRRRGAGGLSAGGAALTAHGLFGLVTVLISSITGLWPAVALAYLAHAAWNLAIIYAARRLTER
ncbi:hypothetical protein [Desulforamulus hydrothermalis]|uniref:Uncharacterized protein n=1 Tax=Desulforamulus hydrothermalis Lam5 = DSM 18033 TaxID=1121428 RepID=K8EAH2_9FIRM|nr:hypothetical protein [Desulforamulus hydrothermalis]CCO08623.1 conserved membrane hypothetical protein [Desulforamulus hydrothermalis Lam5 = DSM 18033]SHH00948.1 hypothetical protein SAMN02745177_01099 [Desulforamulus hydrothermalis Lam5 = DSM 18033]